MTEKSYFWGGSTVGHATEAPYTLETEFAKVLRTLLIRRPKVMGPVEGLENELEVTNPSGSTIRVDTGTALVDGSYYDIDTQDDTTPSNPSSDPRIDVVVLAKDWTAKTVRIKFIAGTEDAAPIAPLLTNTLETEWQIPLAQYQISTGGTISNLTRS